jgi:trigger factor
MEYHLEDVSTVKKKVHVQVPAEEVNAALESTIAMFKKDLKMSGFRQGKVPSSLVEQRFKKDIYQQAHQDLLNVHFNQIFGELGLQPLSGVNLEDVGDFQRDKELNYSISFEVLPEVDLPEYHGLKASQNASQVSEDLVDRAIDRIRQENSSLVPVKEDRQPEDGEVGVIDFQAYQNGQPLENIQAKSFELTLGQGQALEGFESIVKELSPGQTGQGEISFPEDFLNTDLAGQSVSMEVTLNAIKQRQLPDLDEQLAQKVGGHETVESMRQMIRSNFENYFQNMEKSSTQKALLDQILEQIDVELPESLVTSQVDRMLENKREKLEQQGKSLESEGTEAEIRAQLRPEAEDVVKGQVVLLAVANKEGLDVSSQEVEQYIYSTAVRSGQDPASLRDYYEKNNLMFAVRDSLLADKAMEHIYEHASIETIEPQQDDQSGEEPQESGETGSAEGASEKSDQDVDKSAV